MEVPQIKPTDDESMVSGSSTGATDPKFPFHTHPANQPDEYVKCPYFPEHELRRSRLPYHLIKCQNNPRAPNLLACPFNYLHRIRPEDRHEHVQLCEDRLINRYSARDPPPSYQSTLRDHFGVEPATTEPKVNKVSTIDTQSNEEWW